MKIYKLLISKIIFFIIIFIIALIFFFIKNKKIEKFAIDKVNMRVTDDNKALTGILINNLLIYLKFNTGDFTNGNQIIQHGNYKYNAKNIDSNYWQKLVLEEIGLPLYGVEINKWRYYCHKFLERNRNKPKLYEALTKVTELETDLQKLQKQKEILQEKINTIRTTLSI